MKIVNQIEKMLKGEEYLVMSKLWETSKNIITDVKHHTKQITTQMSNYDIHDEKHSEKVLEIIEGIVGDRIENLSFYELLLIYLAAYLHDAAMALPSWEYYILKTVEGIEDCHDNTLSFLICNDFKPIHKYADAVKIVKDNKDKLYDDFSIVQNYVFAENDEVELISDLADLICEYEEFRNGFITELDKYRTSVVEYINFSKLIRNEFIRKTHHNRIVKYVEGLRKKYVPIIGNLDAETFIMDLGNICSSHGEDINFIFNINVYSQILVNNKANIQFVSILLRLGDVIHFSADRAPLSLFAEKRITDETSLIHWKAKFQELKYVIEQQGEYKYVKFSAFCKSPDVFYFIQDYVNWIDAEINNYYMLRQRWEYKRIDNYERYTIPIGNMVDRTQIVSDKRNFLPEMDLKFTLEQSKILELLMGVQLYKDKFLCLRELYQNALDASKCILAYNSTCGISENVSITFGIGEETINEIKQKYIYCLDHGTGMDNYIIKNFFLHIGNSYYKSRDFAKKNVSWSQEVKPTSQFGIGVLSGYMIADKIGITTKYYESGSSAISCILEGVAEHFYYINTRRIDEEKIGNHGTLIKLYLNSELENKINNVNIPKLPLLLMVDDKNIQEEFYNREIYMYNLNYLICQHIGIEHKNVPIYINSNNGNDIRLLSSNTIFDHRNYVDIEDEDVEKLWSKYKYHYLDSSPNPYKDFIQFREYIVDYPIIIMTKNLEVYAHISFPKKGIKCWNIKLTDYCNFLAKHENELFVDGVHVNKDMSSSEFNKTLGYDIVRNSVINFIGERRPVLTVDRNSIVSIPEMKDELLSGKKLFVEQVVEHILSHVNKYEIDLYDEEMAIILEIVTRKFPNIIGKIMRLLCDTKISDAKFPDNVLKNKDISIGKLIKAEEIDVEGIDFRKYKEVTRQIIIGKLIKAEKVEINNFNLFAKGKEFVEFPFTENYYDSLSSVVIKADMWEGIYHEYDLVSSLWPIINPALFDVLNDKYNVRDIVENRCKTISNAGNGLQRIAKSDPSMINPLIGIGLKQKSNYKDKVCYVGGIDRIVNNFSLFELGNHGDTVGNEKRSKTLFAYISPRVLNDIEEKRLSEFEVTDPNYVKGVKEGWSILFLGECKKYVIISGIISKKEIVSKVPNSFITLKSDIVYYNTDGTETFS